MFAKKLLTAPLQSRFIHSSVMANARAARIGNPALFICDIQERFRTITYEFPKLVSTSLKLLRASKPLNIPIYVTTQNTARLGPTVAEFDEYLQPSNPNLRINCDKTLFSMITPEVKEKLPNAASEKPLDAIIVGLESHVCVTQTALDLLSLGHRVYIIADGVSSANAEERHVALARLRDAGAIVTTSESILFEIMGDSKIGVFREISGLVKETGKETKGALEAFCSASKI
ncbi:isochorismatase domain-containing protein [Trichophyton mentagrophytes]|nr:isochorismatase domain-containing protein [Trichophyton mentagrophytes]